MVCKVTGLLKRINEKMTFQESKSIIISSICKKWNFENKSKLHIPRGERILASIAGLRLYIVSTPPKLRGGFTISELEIGGVSASAI